MNLNKVSMIVLFLMFTGCTYSINMVHTQGRAKDVIDETQANTPNVSPNLNIPMSVVPSDTLPSLVTPSLVTPETK